MRIMVLHRVHQRHPNISNDDVISAFQAAEEDAQRADGTWMLLGLDQHGRDLEILYQYAIDKQTGETIIVIFHALTPPTKKFQRQIREIRQQKGRRK